MIITMDRTGTVEEFRQLLEQALKKENIQGLLILACDRNDFQAEVINDLLKDVSIPIFGGIFPQIIFGRNKYEVGTIMVSLVRKPHIFTIPHLSDPDEDFVNAIAEKMTDAPLMKTVFVFVDSLSQRINAFVENLFEIFGLECNFIGGGAGSLNYKQKPCLFTNKGLVEDSAVIAMLDIESGIGVSHGWKTIAGPYQVTRAERNTIYELNWKPAFKVYREVIKIHSGKEINRDNFIEIAKSYPFGIKKKSFEKIVRDPVLLDDSGALTCVGEVPVKSYVDILSSNVNSLVKAAETALNLGEQSFQDDKASELTFFIDCVSRALYLESHFYKELNAVSNNGRPLIGALTLGEIANSGKDYLEFYNKTSVVGILGKS